MKVLIPSPLRSYTQNAWVNADGSTLAEVLDDLDRQFPGIRFRMVNEQERTRPQCGSSCAASPCSSCRRHLRRPTRC